MTERPTCSVIVPTRDRPEQLRACLAGLAQLDYPKHSLQVVVADDGGKVSPDMVVSEAAEALEIEFVRTERVGPAGARNAGVERAGGELLAFIDDDCRPRSDWLALLAASYERAPDHAVGGQTVNVLRDSLCAEAAQLVIDVGYAQNNLGPPGRRWFTTNNLAVPAAGFRALGGFDASYRTAEDRDFCARWLESGRRMSYEPAAVVEHAHQMDLIGFAAMHFGYGRGAFRYHRDRRAQGRPVKVEPSYYAALAREALVRANGGRAVALEGLLLVWHAANTAGFVYEWGRSIRERDRRDRRTP